MASIQIDLIDVLRLKKTWKEKNWDENLNEEYVFKQFCTLFPYLSTEQKELVHELTENYLWLSAKEYEQRFNTIVKSINQTTIKKCTTIYLFPIVKPGDDKKIKSGKHCVYYLKGSIFSFNPLYQNISIEIIEDYASFYAKTFKDDGSELILLVDDFIGSGETFEEAWEEIKKNTSVKKSLTYIFSMIIQKEAFDFIETLGFNIYYTEIRKKGISDHYLTPIKEEKVRIMEEIEDIIKPQFYAFGYKKSEALVTLIRTPDNTFPLFWMKYELKGNEYLGPFFRP